MILVKHLMDAAEPTDGVRIWVEPVGLARDLRAWCRVDQLLPAVAPPRQIWDWFDDHPDGYEYFRAVYHSHLAGAPIRRALIELARSGRDGDFTLLHQATDPDQNSATALFEFLCELQAYCPPDS